MVSMANIVIAVKTKNLLSELIWISRFAESRSTVPILQCAMFEVHPGSNHALKLAATDLELGAMTEVEAGCDPASWPKTAIAAVILSKPVINYLKQVEDDEVQLTISPDLLKISNGCGDEGAAESTAEFKGLPAKDFPAIPVAPKTPGKSIGGLKLALPRVIIAISRKNTRFTLNGALLQITDKDTAVLVSTDGHRLSHHRLSNGVDGCDGHTSFEALIPLRALVELERQKVDCAKISSDENFLFFSTGHRSMAARKLTGNFFPNFKRVMPRKYGHTITLESAPLIKAIKRCISVFDGTLDRRNVTLSIQSGNLTVSCKTGGNKTKANLRVAASPETALEISFNSPYLLEALHLMPETCELRFEDSVSAAELVASPLPGEPLGRWRYVTMPTRD